MRVERGSRVKNEKGEGKETEKETGRRKGKAYSRLGGPRLAPNRRRKARREWGGGVTRAARKSAR